MGDDLRYVAGGAALGALLGALGGLVYSRFLGKPGSSGEARRRGGGGDKGKLLRLGWAIIGLIRQITELG